MPINPNFHRYRSLNHFNFAHNPALTALQKHAKKAKDPNALPTEDDECFSLVFYLDTLISEGRIINYTHIANETRTPYHSVRNRNKRMGVKPGFPDYVICTPTKVIYIEMKRTKGGTLSPEQRVWLDSLRQTGAVAEVCLGFIAAKELLLLHI